MTVIVVGFLATNSHVARARVVAQTPQITGRDRATGTVGQAGAEFVLANGATLLLPSGLPIGNSRTLTFATAGRAPRPASVAPGFVRQGGVYAFDGAINAETAPLVMSVTVRNLAAKPNHDLVIAVEQATICDAQHRERIEGGQLCSGWVLSPATYDAGVKKISAEVGAPGGFRLMFGWVPSAANSAN